MSKLLRYGVLEGVDKGRRLEAYSRFCVCTVHVGEAVLVCVGAGGVDVGLIADAIGVFCNSQGSACCCHVLACGRCRNGGGVLLVGDGLDTVGVVVGELRVEDHLRVDIDASVDEADSIDMQLDSGAVEAATGDFVVLFHEVVGGVSTPVTAVGLTPDTEAVVERLVFGKSVFE
jgi:hypothetical protein